MHGSYCVDLFLAMLVFLFHETSPDWNFQESIITISSQIGWAHGTPSAVYINLLGMSAVKIASSSPFKTLALVSNSSGLVSENGDTRKAAKS